MQGKGKGKGKGHSSSSLYRATQWEIQGKGSTAATCAAPTLNTQNAKAHPFLDTALKALLGALHILPQTHTAKLLANNDNGSGMKA